MKNEDGKDSEIDTTYEALIRAGTRKAS